MYLVWLFVCFWLDLESKEKGREKIELERSKKKEKLKGEVIEKEK